MTEKNHQERNKYYCILTQYLTRHSATLVSTSPTRCEVKYTLVFITSPLVGDGMRRESERKNH